MSQRAAARRMARLAVGFGSAWLARATHRTPPRLPILLAFLTWRCNLGCRMCGVSDLPAGTREDELDTQGWRAVLDSADRLGCAVVFNQDMPGVARGAYLRQIFSKQ